MERVPLTSRAVASAGYDGATRTLEIEFTSGRVYRYRDVPASVYEWLLRVPSKGVYVSRSITDRYEFEDVTHPSAAPADGDLEALLEASVRGSGERA
jgi:hypothetical protein